MTDRKLPVIQLHVVMTEPVNATWTATAFQHRERAELWASAVKGTVLTVEPAVPRCKTCDCFRFAEHATVCGKGILAFPSLDDYCSRHSELRKRDETRNEG